jgi:hypothetical protein
MSLTPFACKMCVKLRKEGFQRLLTSCWHIDEKTRPPTNENIQKLPQLDGETCLLWTNPDKNHPSLVTYEISIVVATPRKKVTYETKSTRVALTMTMSANVGHHQLITQCQLNGAKAVGQGVEAHRFILAKHEILHLSQWSQKHFAQHHALLSFPHHVCNKESGSP